MLKKIFISFINVVANVTVEHHEQDMRETNDSK